MPILVKTDVVRARIETSVKKDAEGILKRLGVSHSAFINMSYRSVVEEGGIPFSMHLPNAATARVLRDARKGVKRAKYAKAATLAEFNTLLGASRKR